jgi:ATP-binding protein involved in chromosome partitioning
MALNEQEVRSALAALTDPVSGKDYVAAKAVKSVKVSGADIAVEIALGYPGKGVWESVRAQVAAHLAALPGAGVVEVTVGSRIVAHAAQRGVKLIPGVKNIIAVASGKGGVGKSTTAVNLALGLAANGLTTGLLDADIYGPSMPRMLGVTEKPESADGKMLKPIEKYGLKTMSIGYIVNEDTPMIWRGPMVSSALEQMLRDVEWGNLDVLVVDMPPGTGDAQLTLAQRVALAGAVIVSTPQDIALVDARKGLNMFRKVAVPVLGIVENMSYFLCPHCGERSEIFGHGGAREEADKLGVPFLGEVPLHLDIRTTSDSGHPIVVSKPDSAHAQVYKNIAGRVWKQLSANQRGARKAPNIVVQ